MSSPRTDRRRRLRTRAAAVVGLATGLAIATASLASATVTSDGTATDLAAAMVTAPSSLTSASLQVAYPCTPGDCPTAVSTTPLAGFPTNGSSYAIMTTGNASLAAQPNGSGSDGEDLGTVNATGIGPTVQDDQAFKVDLGPATGNCVAFDFRFLSEEYPEFVNSGFNDAFVAQLNSRNVTADASTQTLSAPGNFAAGAGDQISVDGAGPSSMVDTAAAGLGTTYDGATALLTARTPVVPGSANSVYFTLFDQGDGIYDSAVFLDNLRYENAKAGQCKSLSLDPYDGGTALSQTASSKVTLTKSKSSLSLPLDCNLPAGPVSCTVNATASFKPSFKPSAARTAARGTSERTAGKPRLLASGSVTIAPDTSGTLVLTSTKQGKKALKAAAAEPKRLKKQAAKLLVQASHAHGAKAAQLRAEAAKLKKQAGKLGKKPLGNVTVTLVNPANGATSVIKAKLSR